MLNKLGQLGDLAGLMTKAKEFHDRMEAAQKELKNVIVTAEAGAGLVKASMNAKGELVRIEIDAKIFSADEKEVVEDLIVAAIKSAQVKATERSETEMSKLTDEIGLPAGFKLPI